MVYLKGAINENGDEDNDREIPYVYTLFEITHEME